MHATSLSKLEERKQAFDSVLREDLLCFEEHYGLIDAIRYILFQSSKRLRPLLVYAIGELFKVPDEKLHPIACSIEYLHNYSLAHDDLPGMDNDMYRRGLPTTHIHYDHATAILVGDALQSMAFERILQHDIFSSHEKTVILKILCRETGVHGMIKGQYLDWQRQNKHPLSPHYLGLIDHLKTGGLFRCAGDMVLSLVPTCDSTTIQVIREVNALLGVAYQYHDDHIDGDTYICHDDCRAFFSDPIPHFSHAKDKAIWLYNCSLDKLSSVSNKPCLLQDIIKQLVSSLDSITIQ